MKYLPFIVMCFLSACVPATQPVPNLPGNQNQLYRVAFSPDGRFLGTTGVDGVLRLWRVEIP
jgi:WD40 repeat protein